MFRSPLLIRTLAGVFIPFAFVVGFILYQTFGLVERLEEEVRLEMKNTLGHVTRDISFQMDNTCRMAAMLAETDGIPEAFFNHGNEHLYQSGRPFINSGLGDRISFVSDGGIVLARSHDEYCFNDRFGDPDLIQKAASGKPPAYFYRENGVWFFRAMAPVYRFNTVFLGVVMMDKQFSGRHLSRMATGFGLDRIEMGTSDEGNEMGLIDSVNEGLFMSSTIEYKTKSGFQPVDIRIYKDVGPDLEEIRGVSEQLVGVTFLVALGAMGFIVWSTRNTLNPIRRMHDDLEAFRKSKLSLPELIFRVGLWQDESSEVGGISKAVVRAFQRVETVQEQLEDLVRDRTLALEIKTDQLSDEIEERKETERKYRLVVENATEAIFLVQDGRIKFPNPKTIELVNAERRTFEAKPFYEFIHTDDQKALKALYQSGELERKNHSPLSFRLNQPDCVVWIQLNYVQTLWKKKPALLCFARDITKLRQAQQALIHTEKMLSLGGLAAGMAHEINNPLGGMMQNAQVLKNRLEEDLPANREAAAAAGITMRGLNAYSRIRKLGETVELINQAGVKAASVVNKMISFARQRPSEKRPWPVDRIIEESIELATSDTNIRAEMDFKNIRIDRQYDPDLPLLYCEKSKICQVIFNILKNAFEAFNEAFLNGEKMPEPFIDIRVSAPKDMFCVEIEDNGPGMGEEVKNRIFEPFYTTKPVGVGTGLGLSTAYFIVVEDHDGTIHASSTRGKGSRFSICFPKHVSHPASLHHS